MTYEEMKKKASTLYPVNKVAVGYRYWVRLLLEKCINIFTYTNLPDSLPQSEVELRLLQTGYCCIFDDKKYGLVTCYGSLHGMDLYYRPVNFTYSQPILGSGALKIGTNCEIILNSKADGQSREGIYNVVRRYARMLADIESSINIVTVNTRAMSLLSAKNEIVAKTLDEVISKLAMGEMKSINEGSILDLIKTFPYNDAQNRSLPELLKARRDILSAFLEEIGIQTRKEKRERMITDEVHADVQLLLINQKDMLECRQEGIEKVNKLFDTKITVDISDEYKPKKEDVNNDGSRMGDE